MPMILRKLAGAAKKLFRKIAFRIKLFQMDSEWRWIWKWGWGTSYPPSFYYTHTKEEIERIKAKDRAELRKLIDKMD